MLLPECVLCLQTPSPAARNQASFYKPVGHGGGGGSHSSCSVPRPASLDATRQRATSFSHPFFRFVPRKHKNHVSSGHCGSSQSSSQLLFTYVLALISASACVCSFVYEHGASVCVCMGVLVALVWRSQSLRVPALLSRSCVKAAAQMTDMSI